MKGTGCDKLSFAIMDYLGTTTRVPEEAQPGA
jgi:hypothetical protein